MLLPVTCPVCGARGAAPCAGCRSRLAPPPALPPPVGLDRCVAAVAYDGVGRELVARLKYRNDRAALPFLAAAVAAAAGGEGVDVVTWAPTTAARRRRRGFDQAELLARAVARRLGLPCSCLLRRRPPARRPGGGGGAAAQTGRSAAERFAGPAFAARRPMAGARVLVVDDVVTTGATATAAGIALRAAGAVSVTLAVAARTPPGRASRLPSPDVHSGRVAAAGRAGGP
ncbi:MAG: phosphoribosyltransferase family protein [Acidimicrobiales bacterium]